MRSLLLTWELVVRDSVLVFMRTPEWKVRETETTPHVHQGRDMKELAHSSRRC